MLMVFKDYKGKNEEGLNNPPSLTFSSFYRA